MAHSPLPQASLLGHPLVTFQPKSCWVLTLNCTNWSNMAPMWRVWAPRRVRTSSFCSLLSSIGACCARRRACLARRSARASADRITVLGQGMWQSIETSREHPCSASPQSGTPQMPCPMKMQRGRGVPEASLVLVGSQRLKGAGASCTLSLPWEALQQETVHCGERSMLGSKGGHHEMSGFWGTLPRESS